MKLQFEQLIDATPGIVWNCYVDPFLTKERYRFLGDVQIIGKENMHLGAQVAIRLGEREFKSEITGFEPGRLIAAESREQDVNGRSEYRFLPGEQHGYARGQTLVQVLSESSVKGLKWLLSPLVKKNMQALETRVLHHLKDQAERQQRSRDKELATD